MIVRLSFILILTLLTTMYIWLRSVDWEPPITLFSLAVSGGGF